MRASSGPMIAAVEKIELSPQSRPANGPYSTSSGTPIISLEMAAQNKLLRCSSLRLNGLLTITGGSTCDGAGAKGAQLDQRVGAHGLFQSITVSNSAGQILESARARNTLCASTFAATHSPDDYISQSASNVATGLQGSSAMPVRQSNLAFSIPLSCAIFRGSSAIPLAQVGGLKITIDLAQPSQGLYSTDGTAPAAAAYTISGAPLSADLITLATKGPQSNDSLTRGQFSYNQFSSLYSALSSADATLTLNLPQKNALPVSHAFSKASGQRNLGAFSLATPASQNSGDDAALNQVDFARAGQKLIYDCPLRSSAQAAENLPETEALMANINCFQPFCDATHLPVNPVGCGFGQDFAASGDIDESGAAQVKVPDAGRRAFGLGVNCDPISETGLSFAGMPHAARIQSTLGQTAANSAHTHVLSRATLSYSPAGVVVAT